MTTYTLRRVSASTWDITTGRRKVGFARAVPVGYVARIGNVCETAPTIRAAFDMVVAKTCGFKTPAALAEHNRGVRQHNAALRAEADRAFAAALSTEGNFAPLFDLISKL
jgi:hypothetical protein